MRTLPWIAAAASDNQSTDPPVKTRFDPVQLLTDPKNWQVWKRFLEFSAAILFLPVAAFALSDYFLRRFFDVIPQRSQAVGAFTSIITVQILIYYYAVLAVKEETTHFNDQHIDTTDNTHHTNTDIPTQPATTQMTTSAESPPSAETSNLRNRNT